MALLALLNRAYTGRYPIPFLNARATKVGVCHFLTKMVAMATSLEISVKQVQVDRLRSKRFHSFHIMRQCTHFRHRQTDRQMDRRTGIMA